MLRFIPALALLLFTACGLAENEQDDKNKRIYITFTDPAFERFCLGMFNLDHDGRISRYEAQRVLVMDCSGRNISAMWEIGEFSRLRELDCSGNNLTRLDLRKCPDLQKLDCGDNEITSLDIDGLRGLAVLDCAGNLLARLDLKSNSSLRQLDCRGNLLVTLDLTPCSGQLQADTRDNPFLTTVYRLGSQGVDYNGRPRWSSADRSLRFLPPRIVFRWLPASVSCWLSVSVPRRLPASFPAGSPHCSPRRFPSPVRVHPPPASFPAAHIVPRWLPTSLPAARPHRFPSVVASVSCRSRRCLLPSAAGLRHAYF